MILDALVCACAIAAGWCFGEAQYGTGPFVRIGRWRNQHAADKTLRLLHATAPGAARFFPWAPWEHLSIPRADAPRET